MLTPSAWLLITSCLSIAMPEGMSPIGCGCSRRSDGRKGRNLVVNLDGTSNQYGTNNTNVIELFSRIAASNEQLKYYNSGIGTYARPSWRSWGYAKQIMENWVDLAIANFETVLIGAYRWLSDQYQEGDRIFLFGFSRGAYQVRALAGMIEKIGLIHRGNEEQIPFAYELYADDSVTKDKAAHFKKTFSVKNVRVHFIGVWDSVSSIGLVRGAELPLVGSCDHVCVFRHALALDECRVKFMPECMARPDRPLPLNAKEVWFPGSHSDVGGGLLPNDELNLQSIPLLWMEREALFAGLHLQQSNIGSWEIRHLELEVPFDSLGRFSGWRILEYLPIPRESPTNPSRVTWLPHFCEGRSILPGQKIHASIAFRQESYAPIASFYKHAASEKTPPNWGDIVGRGQAGQFRNIDGWEDILELDIFDASVVPHLLDRLQEEEFNEENRMSILDHLRFLNSLPEIDHSMRMGILRNLPVEELVAMLHTADCVLAAETLSKLANTVDARATINMAGGIGILVNMLSGGNSRSAALVLQALMRHGWFHIHLKASLRASS
ncbi:hypothetical protein FIBSPDRAFT_216725 [Athelia psychrophila]|uniref:T6SS Phospholipase effector Tle1-like catalytic domain-containing protein n=1 Tax=Athelia psychrophila TaxID=1759441 RepID=A0A165ZCV9_9AGAM|nr:hypothetical protein FIBSPDRAFT_216725 [Fibularhizoctonia sp. CBS 109695]